MSDLFDVDCSATAPVSYHEPAWTPVAFACDRDEATWYCSILEEADIPACTGETSMFSPGKRGEYRHLPVLVPSSLHERSGEIIAIIEATLSEERDDDDEDDDVFDDDLEDDDEDDDFDDDPEDDFDDDLEDDDDFPDDDFDDD